MAFLLVRVIPNAKRKEIVGAQALAKPDNRAICRVHGNAIVFARQLTAPPATVRQSLGRIFGAGKPFFPTISYG
jgi:hypothetical protein